MASHIVADRYYKFAIPTIGEKLPCQREHNPFAVAVPGCQIIVDVSVHGQNTEITKFIYPRNFLALQYVQCLHTLYSFQVMLSEKEQEEGR